MENLDIVALENLSVVEIENKRVEKLKELEIESQHTAFIEQEYLKLQRQIIMLQLKKKDTEVALSKAKSNIRALKNQIEILKSIFWQKKT